jgi:hypothetical protein
MIEVRFLMTLVELVGFAGCPALVEARDIVRAAVESAGGDVDFRQVDQLRLDPSDPRRGWPSPTILVDGADLFGLPCPRGSSLCCRIYPDGFPDAQAIAARLRAIGVSGG